MAITFGPQFLINTATGLDQEDMSLAGLANGLFVAAFEAENSSSASNRVHLQGFNADGSKRGTETDFDNSAFGSFNPDLAAAPDGTFHLGVDTKTPSDDLVKVRRFDIDQIVVSSGGGLGSSGLDESEIAIAVRSDGGRFAVWQASNSAPAADDPDIRGLFFIDSHANAVANGSSVGHIISSTTTGPQTRPDVAALENGRFVTVWETNGNVAFRFTSVTYGPDPNNPNNPSAAIATNLGTDTGVAQGERPAVAALPNGNFVVLWYHNVGSSDQILGRIYDATGNSSGALLGDFVAATNVAATGVNLDIAVTVLDRNEFAVGWTGLAGTSPNGVDNSGTYVDAAIFNSGAPAGTGAFTVAASLAAFSGGLTGITTGDQFDPSLTTLADGRFVLGWSDASASADDNSGLAVRGRIIDARTSAVTVNGTPGHDDYIGTAFNDHLNGFAGADKLTGAAGNDSLDGGTGADTLFCGNGNDTVVYSTGYGADTVQDFVLAVAGDTDQADLRGVSNVHTFADVLARASQVGDDTVIDFGAGDTLTLKFVNKANLTAANFLLTNNAPVITSNGGGTTAAVSVGENSTAVTIVTATDPDVPTTLVYSITGGADAAKFKIAPATGALAFIAAPDFEAPADADGNNSYEVRVTVGDGNLKDSQTITINVTDVNEQTDPGPGPNPTPAPSPGSALFDVPFYLSHNPDVAAAGVDPLTHYNTFGFHEGRDPNAFFDTSGYLAVNKDVAAAGVSPLDHFHLFGWKEGRDPGPDFDTTFYLLRNPDVAAALFDPLEHFLQFGQFEGRPSYAAIGAIANGFDAQFYLFHNPDVAAAGSDARQHFDQFGRFEGRNPNAFFDTAGYLSHYADVAAAGVNPLDHYIAFGFQEGRDPSASFDTLGYLAANPDVAAAHVNPLDHFLTFGIYEGRTVVNDGLFH